MSYKKIEACRVCKSKELTTILQLGEQALTGVFPKAKGQKVTTGPLDLVKCMGPCGLVQLHHSYDADEMYGDNYGYRSGLNRSMVEHLGAKVTKLRSLVPLAKGDVVLDIGSNDGTTLSFYPENEATLFGIDPTSDKFSKYYRADIKRIADFFTAANFKKLAGERKAKIVTSIAMFYDLESPLTFMKDIHECLADDGVWHFEQSYLPTMIDALAYDTACHEHLEYYGMAQIQWMAKEVGFTIVDVSLNDVNGGSFAVTVQKTKATNNPELPAEAKRLLDLEKQRGFDKLPVYEKFAKDVATHRDELKALVAKLASEGKKVFCMGASTKGNVVLQYCGFTEKDLTCVAEVNDEKFGRFTPGTEIPIVSEADAAAKKPDAYLVLPWHFRKNLIGRQQAYLKNGGKLLFPLPKIELYGE